uniref:Citrate transporter-like domain-containing protein n=1 Tax=Strigamia maritima TaxID=126957 RepID=T1JFJ2_STRMM
MPILGDMSESIRVHPIYLMFPATIACSYAFMLPIATPPNAIVFEVCGMSTWDMMKPGIVTNILSLAVLVFMINTLGVYLFNLNEYPIWAMQKLIVNNSCIGG